jgi:hypothetical protein
MVGCAQLQEEWVDESEDCRPWIVLIRSIYNRIFPGRKVTHSLKYFTECKELGGRNLTEGVQSNFKSVSI